MSSIKIELASILLHNLKRAYDANNHEGQVSVLQSIESSLRQYDTIDWVCDVLDLVMDVEQDINVLFLVRPNLSRGMLKLIHKHHVENLGVLKRVLELIIAEGDKATFINNKFKREDYIK